MNHNLKIRTFGSYLSEEWDQILLGFDASINYTFWFINYIEILNEASNIKNYTFVVYQENYPIAIIPIYVEQIEKNFQISMGQEPINAPIFCANFKIKDKSKVVALIMENINKIANQNKCILARFHLSPLLKDRSIIKYFKECGYTEDIKYPSWYIFKCKYSYLIKLEMDKKTLFNKIRKGHRSNITKSQKNLTLYVLDKYNYSQELFNRYVNLYFQIKGGKRNPKAFKLDSLGVKSGFQTIMLCENENELVGAIALHIYKDKARYNSSVVNHSECKEFYPTHFLLWSAIMYLKNRKFELFEIGEQVVESDLYEVTQKEKNLSHFKAGWGADLVPWLKVQKNY